MTTPGKAAPQSEAEIDAALLRGALLLTPNQRSARACAQRFDLARRAAGQQAWRPADILPWRAWVQRTWSQLQIAGLESRVLLSKQQELYLWQTAIETSSEIAPSARSSLASACVAAERLLAEFDLGDGYAKQHLPETRDSANFRTWRQTFIDLCEKKSLLPAAWAERELQGMIAGGSAVVPGELILWDIVRLLPSQQAIVTSLERRGTTVSHQAAVSDRPSRPQLMVCTDEPAEIAACCAWVRDTMATGATLGRPVAIEVVVPDLQACRAPLERSLRRMLAPEADDLTRNEATPFEFAVGRKLASTPAVRDALTFLRWCLGELSPADVGSLLRSSHLALARTPEEGAEVHAFVLAEARLPRQALRIQGAVDALNAWSASRSGRLADATNAVIRRLGFVNRMASQLGTRRKDFSSWAAEMRKLLEAGGWPGVEAQSSLVYQILDRWEETVDAAASLDIVAPRVTFEEFLSHLKAAATDTLFAPENTGAPIQIVTPAEAAGSTADALWFLHADAERWNGRRSATPLLSWALQRDLHMPGANGDSDDARAYTETQRLAGSANAVVFSYARVRGGVEQTPSTLVDRLPQLARHVVEPSRQEASAPAIEVVTDDSFLPLPPGDRVAGGTAVLEAQAQCGFRAFAERRLFSTAVGVSEAGLSPVERGSIVHSALENFWADVNPKTQARLKQMSAERVDGGTERSRVLRSSIARAIAGSDEHPWDTAHDAVQAERLFRLLGAWLDLEEARPPFEVLGHEVDVPDAEIGGLRLHLRVDRMDRIGTGDAAGTLLVDYKTGSDTLRDWEGPRIDSPQLPLYAVSGGIDNVLGIALAKVRSGSSHMWLNGVGAVEEFASEKISKKRTSFEDLLAEWHASLEQLAHDFVHGATEVDPKDPPATCKYCAQRLLCRLDTTAQYIEDEPEFFEADRA